MKVELNKKYRYRNGEPARVVCVDAPGEYPVIAIGYESGEPTTHTESGKFKIDGCENPSDLIEVREPPECWLSVDEYGQIITGEGVRLCPIQGRRLFREVID